MTTLKIKNLSDAKAWARFATWATVVATIATAASGMCEFASGSLGVPLWQLLSNILILATLALLMFRFSRVASLIALLLYLLNVMFLPTAYPMLRGSIFNMVAFFFGVVYLNGARAMFVWHRLTTQAASGDPVSMVTAD